jgi:hypothetical protein
MACAYTQAREEREKSRERGSEREKARERKIIKEGAETTYNEYTFKQSNTQTNK